MTPMLTVFITAIELTGRQRLLLLIPLCLAVAVVYKTTRCHQLREVPRAAAVLLFTTVIGLFTVGITLWALFILLA